MAFFPRQGETLKNIFYFFQKKVTHLSFPSSLLMTAIIGVADAAARCRLHNERGLRNMEKMMGNLDVLSMGYGVIPNRMISDRHLSIEAKGIYCYIAACTGSGETDFPSVELICSDLKISNQRFRKHKKELVERGYLTIESGQHKGKFINNRYILGNGKG
ncbi:Hypothetical protein Tpal_2247 [Trichococcus palustris]|uniref:Helix-turn-helix domain-containing protein n=2 Tax=Trichococcus palustris TaxID=140314 RepID=A0A143YVB1_9LACT|nr:Hypothetical protein Tpal_2247 [Trichococcus palustris]SFK95090.1 Helix-turn-helix domain-containing protein [Trichococcus palustris]